MRVTFAMHWPDGVWAVDDVFRLGARLRLRGIDDEVHTGRIVAMENRPDEWCTVLTVEAPDPDIPMDKTRFVTDEPLMTQGSQGSSNRTTP